MKIGRGWIYAGILAYVLGSSLTGLLNAMLTAGVRIFSIVWGASLLGDILFVGGTLAVGWGAYALAERGRWVPCVLVGLVGTWLVYTLSWSVTAPAINPDNNAEFARASSAAWVFTLQWGWPGILFAAIGPPLASIGMRGHVPAKPVRMETATPTTSAPPSTAAERPGQ